MNANKVPIDEFYKVCAMKYLSRGHDYLGYQSRQVMKGEERYMTPDEVMDDIGVQKIKRDLYFVDTDKVIADLFTFVYGTYVRGNSPDAYLWEEYEKLSPGKNELNVQNIGDAQEVTKEVSNDR